ncbi:hypothetical protein DFH07DRAFT_763766 [Mycena maculata]|uniref:Uncharacterized protein n=1 Tax=Mycena maculata TaxID=230809 RepID=A0AAD7P2R6_9AGAR|nr:hypothetical protein DFH07DRAFT_763766 [Mycena maculata]
MRFVLFTAALLVLTATAAPLGAPNYNSVVRRDNQPAVQSDAKAAPPWRKSTPPAREDPESAVQNDAKAAPPWRKSTPAAREDAEPSVHSDAKAAPPWRKSNRTSSESDSVPALVVTARLAQPTPPPWRRDAPAPYASESAVAAAAAAV